MKKVDFLKGRNDETFGISEKFFRWKILLPLKNSISRVDTQELAWTSQNRLR